MPEKVPILLTAECGKTTLLRMLAGLSIDWARIMRLDAELESAIF